MYITRGNERWLSCAYRQRFSEPAPLRKGEKKTDNSSIKMIVFRVRRDNLRNATPIPFPIAFLAAANVIPNCDTPDFPRLREAKVVPPFATLRLGRRQKEANREKKRKGKRESSKRQRGEKKQTKRASAILFARLN